ncbi:MAG: hypothetical protein WBO08_01430 [Mycobacterium sp.]|nr:hypothetical protein [Mycobacterium sp.]
MQAEPDAKGKKESGYQESEQLGSGDQEYSDEGTDDDAGHGADQQHCG